MTARTLMTSAVLLLMTTGEAFAVKTLVTMTPPLRSGFSFRMSQLENELLRLTITRDLSDVSPSLANEPHLTIRRSARLAVRGESGLIAMTEIAPEGPEQGLLVYTFIIDRKYAARSWLTLSEIENYQDKQRTSYIGGGVIYTFLLGDFIAAECRNDEFPKEAPKPSGGREQWSIVPKSLDLPEIE